MATDTGHLPISLFPWSEICFRSAKKGHYPTGNSPNSPIFGRSTSLRVGFHPIKTGRRNEYRGRVILFKTTERCIVQRTSLLQLRAAITRLENEGWKIGRGGPAFMANSTPDSSYWWVSMRRAVPMKVFNGDCAFLFPRKPTSDSNPHVSERMVDSYTPAAGQI
jgi:hypothetical protein